MKFNWYKSVVSFHSYKRFYKLVKCQKQVNNLSSNLPIIQYDSPENYPQSSRKKFQSEMDFSKASSVFMQLITWALR